VGSNISQGFIHSSAEVRVILDPVHCFYLGHIRLVIHYPCPWAENKGRVAYRVPVYTCCVGSRLINPAVVLQRTQTTGNVVCEIILFLHFYLFHYTLL